MLVQERSFGRLKMYKLKASGKDITKKVLYRVHAETEKAVNFLTESLRSFLSTTKTQQV